MMKKYKILENVAIADIAFEVKGKSYNELFENAASAILEETSDTKKIIEKEKKEIKLKNKNIEDLLFDFLSEILYLKDTFSMLFKSSKVTIDEKGGNFKLKAELAGEKINKSHVLKSDIKAITLHMFKVEKTNKGFKAVFVVDV